MKRWQMSIGLTVSALVAAVLAPRLLPLLQAPVEAPVAQVAAEAPVAQVAVEAPVEVVEAPRSIDIVIAIDTSGSMERLLDSTRARLWDIVNNVDAQAPNARLRVGLIAYGTPNFGASNQFVRVVMPLTDDLDALYTEAWSLRTDGGDEYVGAVIDQAIDTIAWSDNNNPENRRLLFIAGNETAALGPVRYQASASRARRHGISVSTLFAGRDSAGRSLQWDRVAQFGGGRYMAIDARRSAVSVSTPYDQELVNLNLALNDTFVAGTLSGNKQRDRMLDNDTNTGSYGLGGLASRVVSKASGRMNYGAWDLVEQQTNGDFDPAAIDANLLPEELKGLNEADLKTVLADKANARKGTEKKIKAVQAKRRGFLRANAKDEGGGMDEAMSEMLDELL